jgi:hypothetical protein
VTGCTGTSGYFDGHYNSGCVPYGFSPIIAEDEYQIDIYFLARGPTDLAVHDAELYKSTGNPGGTGGPGSAGDSNPAWLAIHPGKPYYYFERQGCCGDAQNWGYIWYVVPGSGTEIASRVLIQEMFPELLNNGIIIDSIYGNVFNLVYDSTSKKYYWEIQCDIKSNSIKCICIEFNGI